MYEGYSMIYGTFLWEVNLPSSNAALVLMGTRLIHARLTTDKVVRENVSKVLGGD